MTSPSSPPLERPSAARSPLRWLRLLFQTAAILANLLVLAFGLMGLVSSGTWSAAGAIFAAASVYVVVSSRAVEEAGKVNRSERLRSAAVGVNLLAVAGALLFAVASAFEGSFSPLEVGATLLLLTPSGLNLLVLKLPAWQPAPRRPG